MLSSAEDKKWKAANANFNNDDSKENLAALVAAAKTADHWRIIYNRADHMGEHKTAQAAHAAWIQFPTIGDKVRDYIYDMLPDWAKG